MEKTKIRFSMLLGFAFIIVGLYWLSGLLRVGNEVVPPIEIPKAGSVAIAGVIVCLPHRDISGPQTLECAFGLKDDFGRYFSLRDSDPNYQNISSVPMNERVLVEGDFEPGSLSIYQDIGTIEVEKITRKPVP